MGPNDATGTVFACDPSFETAQDRAPQEEVTGSFIWFEPRKRCT